MAPRLAPFILLLTTLVLPACRAADDPASGARTVTIFNAGSLGSPLAAVARAFEAAHPGVTVHQETTGSLEAARKLTELGKIPDVLGVADVHVLTTLIEPAHADWHAVFATNAMVLLRSEGAAPLDSTTWVAGLLRPGTRTARADPELDPNGYRTLMAVQLASRAAGDPGLESKLLASMPPAFMRPKEAELTALVQA
ncbi:MAG: substrate-binding domain-containing protein, partial [Gemmatimonadales bacterium]